MSYQVMELQFESARPLHSGFHVLATIITETSQETFVNFQQQKSLQFPCRLQIAVCRNDLVYGAAGQMFYVLKEGAVLFYREFAEEIKQIRSTPDGTIVRMKSSVFIKSGTDEYMLELPLQDIVRSRHGLYGISYGKLIYLSKTPRIIMDCPLTECFYDGFAIGINKHKRLSIYDKSGCRGYFEEDLKVKNFLVLSNNILVCFTKDQRVITLGLQLEYQYVKFVIMGNISSPIWQQGLSQKFVAARMFYGSNGISIVRGSSVLLISHEALMAKINHELLDQCTNEYEIIKMTATYNVDCSQASVLQSLRNTYQVLLGVQPFGREIRDYKQLMHRFGAVYQLALNQQSGVQIDFNPFIAEMQRNLTQIYDYFTAFIKRKIPTFEIGEGLESRRLLNENQDLFLTFLYDLDQDAYYAKRKEQIYYFEQLYRDSINSMIADSDKMTYRQRTVVPDALCGVESDVQELALPASDPPVKKVVKKVVVKKVIKKTIKVGEAAQEQEAQPQQAADLEKQQEEQEQEQPETYDKPKIKKIVAINRVVIKKAPKIEESSEEEEQQPIQMPVQQQYELISYKKQAPAVQQAERTAEDQPYPEDVKKKPVKVSIINRIKISRAEKPTVPTGQFGADEQQENYRDESVPEESDKTPFNQHSRTESHSKVIAEDLRNAGQAISNAVKATGAEIQQVFTRYRPSCTETEFYKQISQQYQAGEEHVDSDFVPTLYTSDILLPHAAPPAARYRITDETILYAARTDALAQLETFNSFTRAQELAIFDQVYDNIIGQVLMIVPKSSIVQNRFLVLPTENAQEAFFLRAYDLRLHREIACRILPGFMNSKANQYYINKLEHPNLVRILAVGSIFSKEGVYQCAVFVEKPYYYSLKQLLEFRLRLFKTQEQVKYFAKQILQLLKYLNSSKMHLLHRDISPEQIFVNPETLEIQLFHTGQIRATDFNEPACQQTVYAAPEILCGVAATSSDIWSLGVCVFRLLELAANQEPISLFEPGGFGLSEAPPPGANGEVLNAVVANSCICIRNYVVNASDFAALFEEGRGCICSQEHAVEFVSRYGNRIQVMPAVGKMPWDTEATGFEREDAIGSLQDVDEAAREFLSACWVFDYQKRIEAEWMLGFAWLKDSK